MSAIIGIDLGTTNSCVAIYANGKPQILLNGEGDRTTPSVVTFRDDGGALVGGPAHRQAVMNPTKTITGVKRLVGRRFDSEEVFALRAMAPYEIVAAPNGDAWVQIGGRTMSPPEVQSYILQALRASASAYLGQDVTRAVITVPAYFDDAQRQATRDAAEIAGLEVARILNEPTAAALAHGYTRGDGRRLAVIDLGGGTFDITVMTVEDGMFEVLSTTGDMLLGGEDFDRVIASRLGEEIRRDHGFDAFADPVAAQRLMSEAESAKKQLTSIDTVTLSLPFFGQSSKGPINVERALTRAELEQLAQPLLARLAEPCRAALADAKLGPGAVDDVLLVGGMTRALCVQRCVAELFGKRPSLRINPDEAVALGAAIESGVLAGALEDVVLVDVAPHTIGLRVAGDRMVPLIPRQTPLPSRVTRVFSTTRDGQDYVEVEVVQGEAPKASHNRRLARVRLEGLPRAPKGQVKVAVTFKVDASGMLSVSAVDRASGRAVEAAVTAESGLARPEVMRIAHERARGGMRWS